ncbi:peptidyl-prolyl cis-trans isomerase D [Andreprevotia lacus DSM 23236]|jgi:peptidyl-prolyl cis-trans isomerase D|uniref:Periplasmic chaperone PpiD n=1 Tax=Andreprevotia lacus DSM 23236 TaxID=1121001 RepID=A0A1W1X5U4_9NEIS|nr:SurA N-terminal domain-containing protein [Andreprevotia lacus]SMC19210.1 peptidyl-prolyl cis-trans isomerase D [Andreprevotia lacus DSM 23236]
MFDFVEKNKTSVQVVLGLVALGLMVGVGVQGLSALQGGNNYLAKVGSTEITEADVAKATQGQPVSNEMKPMVVRQLIDRQLVLEQAHKLHFGPSADQLRDTIAAYPVFQENGQFNNQTYQKVLAAQGMSPKDFEKLMSDDLAGRQLLSALPLSVIASNATLDRLTRAIGEKRLVAGALINPADYLAQATVSDAEIKQYYDKNAAQFKLPEQVKLEYIALSRGTLVDAQVVSDADVQKYFDEHQKELTREQRKASHILIAVAPSANAEQQKAAQDKAEALLKQARANPAKFGELAKANSDDKGSGANGGDLGWFDDSVQFVPEFKAAALKLGKGEFSGLVRTQFGFHIIHIDDVKTRTLADVKPEIVAQLKQQKAQTAFQAQLEKFNDTVYNQADSLKPAADAYKLAIMSSDWVSKTSAKDSVLNNPKLLEAVFSDDVLKKKHNTEGIETLPGTVVAARVVDYKPAQQQPLASVSADIQIKLKQEKAAKLAADDGAKKLAALQKGQDVPLKWQEQRELTRMGDRSVDPKALNGLFSVPAAKLPAYASGNVPGQGFVIYKAIKSIPAEQPGAGERKGLMTQLERAYGKAEQDSYLDGIKANFKVVYGHGMTAPAKPEAQ